MTRHLLVLCCLLICPLQSSRASTDVYFGGDIITMAGEEPLYAEALAVRDGKIEFVGSKEEAIKVAGEGARQIDLGGKTLLPGFIDAHGHMVYFGKNLMDQSLSGVKDIPELVQRMKQHAAKVAAGTWIVGMGYAPLKMTEQRHPKADELDEISRDQPVLVVHSSGHGGSMNHALMKLLGINEKTANPEGGEYSREKRSDMPSGPMEETALIDVRNKRPPFTGEAAARVITGAAKIWASNGQTTAMECGLGLGADDISIVENAIDHELLPIDLVVFAKESSTEDVISRAYGVSDAYTGAAGSTAGKILADRPDVDKRYINRVRLGGIKFWLDGNPVMAWMSQPFAQPPPGREHGYKGYGQISDEMIFQFFDKYWTSNMQINMHVMGDEASEQALRAIEAAIEKHGMSDHRPVFVHAGYLRPDQLERIKKVGGIPSFLSYSLYMQGDEIEPLWGKERSENANATGSMVKAHMPFTISHDAPITPPAILPAVWSAVNRVTLSGRIVGAGQRISPYEALRAVTAHAAYQIKEEKSKGTLEPGKLADFVVLDRNPLKVDAMDIKNIKVVETIKEGRSIFRLENETSSSAQSATSENLGRCVHDEAPQKPNHNTEDQATIQRLMKAAFSMR